MAEQIGIITAIDPDGLAKVLSDRKGACGGCHSGHGGCRSCLAGSKFESRVTNTMGAQPGDLVKVSLNSSSFFKGAALLASHRSAYDRCIYRCLGCWANRMAANHRRRFRRHSRHRHSYFDTHPVGSQPVGPAQPDTGHR